MCVMYNSLQNTKRFAFNNFCYKFNSFSSHLLFHYLHFEKFSETYLNKLVGGDMSYGRQGKYVCLCIFPNL